MSRVGRYRNRTPLRSPSTREADGRRSGSTAPTTAIRNCFGKPRYAPEVESSAEQTAILVSFGVLLQQKRSVEGVFSLLPNCFLEDV
jgi:hypothetical protein